MRLLIDYAMSFVGKPYIWGGEGPTGFDCSGLTQEILRSVGEDPPGDQTADALYEFAVLNWERLERFPEEGAVVFYGWDRVVHVAFAVDHFRVIEAGGGGPGVLSPSLADEKNAMIRVRPFNRRSDIKAIYRPNYGSKLGT